MALCAPASSPLLPEFLSRMSSAAAPDPSALLAWYDRHARTLPWRTGPKARRAGVRPDPYRVWLSEIMLQQTTVQAVAAYFVDFTTRWPTVTDLARAPLDDVLKAWAGLGYYARARNLKAAAEMVADRFGGVFPDTVAGLQELPGIGPYTAGAIAAIAFGRKAAAVDGNVERVVSRLHAIETPLPAAKTEIRARTEAMVPADRPGEFAEAMMDLGATLCSPKRPTCALCPFQPACIAGRAGDAERFPVKAPKTEKPTRYGAAFVAVRADGAVLVERRPETGLLGAMTGTPGTDWGAATPGDAARSAAPVTGDWQRRTGTVRHTFTHFHLVLDIWQAAVPMTIRPPAGMWWALPDDLPGEALPTLFVKVIAHALEPAAVARPRGRPRKTG